MRKGINANHDFKYKIIGVDDEEGVLDTLGVFLNKAGYGFVGVTDPLEAIEKVREEHFDLMLLDFIMTPLHGDQVVEHIRKFNKELYQEMVNDEGCVYDDDIRNEMFENMMQDYL